MAPRPTGTTPSQFRLPAPAREFIEQRAAERGITKTEVVLEALACLREREIEERMAEGYRFRAKEHRALAEEGLLAAEEAWPEW
jgi:hypothetical protein